MSVERDNAGRGDAYSHRIVGHIQILNVRDTVVSQASVQINHVVSLFIAFTC
ncbi:hypothetical protein [Dyadobacter sp. OTU695]|uniref:hypothetical protein n=1 Tax=Dyadobacter sp. OTU695 TaxID=3043860 RepID=UPI00313BC83B